MEMVYGWIKTLSYYLVLVTALLQMIPENAYRKYVRFFTGLVLILLLVTPVFQILDERSWEQFYTDAKEWAAYTQEVQKKGENLSEASKNSEKIEVKEIEIRRGNMEEMDP